MVRHSIFGWTRGVVYDTVNLGPDGLVLSRCMFVQFFSLDQATVSNFKLLRKLLTSQTMWSNGETRESQVIMPVVEAVVMMLPPNQDYGFLFSDLRSTEMGIVAKK